MAGNSLVSSVKMQCPHGGTVQVTPSNLTIKADRDAMVVMSDTFTITGCTFQIPTVPPIPSPCVTIRWLIADSRVKLNGSSSLSETSTGQCLSKENVPQGPVIITNTQRKASSM